MVKMVPSYWHFALVQVLVLFISTSVVVTDTPACDLTKDQHCLTTPTLKPNVIVQQKALIREQQNLRELQPDEHPDYTRNTERTGRDTDRHWDHRQKIVSRDSPRLYDRIRGVKKSVLNQDESKQAQESRRHLTGSRRYLNNERLSDLDSSEIEKLGQGTLRERLLHKFALSATEDGYHTGRAQRRFSRLRDDVQSARFTTRFEKFQQNRMKNVNNKDEEDNGSRTVTRFERNRNDRLVRSSKGDINLRAQTETDRLLPRHFRNFDKIRENIDRRESGFERRNAYIALIRNHVRVTDDSLKDDAQKVEPRFEVQRKHRQELETSLRKENAANVKDDDKHDIFMQNRRMRNDQRREMEERMIREEKQRIYEEEKNVREEAKQVRDREHKILETEREVKEIIKQIHENERKAREERQKKLDEEKRLRQQTVERPNEKPFERNGDRFNVYDNEEKIYDDERQFRIDEDRQYKETEKDYDESREIFDDDSDEQYWDYSDYSDSDSSESYENDADFERRIREDIRLFPDIERQVRENAQMYGREYLDAREMFSDEMKDSADDGHQLRNEKREIVDENNNRSKRAIENSQIIRTDRRIHNSSNRKSNERQRQIAERRSFRSQDERLTRRINLRQMNEERQFENENADMITRQEYDRRSENSRNQRIELEKLERSHRRQEDNRRIEVSRDRRIELGRLEWNHERREGDRRVESERSERNHERRADNERVEVSRNGKIEGQEQNRRVELERSERNHDRREGDRRVELERSERNHERREHDRRVELERSERNHERRKDNGRIELERSERNHERRMRLEETERREYDRRVETSERSYEQREDNRQIELKTFERNHEQTKINLLLQSPPITEFSIQSEQKQRIFDSIDLILLLKASFIGILVLKVLTEQEFLMKKLRSASLFKRLVVFNNVIN